MHNEFIRNVSMTITCVQRRRIEYNAYYMVLLSIQNKRTRFLLYYMGYILLFLRSN